MLKSIKLDKSLHILNASAGSGKTFHLVKEYIKLLINDKEDKSSFSNIIAMTFTNKAALEMKERIIKALDEISSPAFFKNSSDDLTKTICTELNLKQTEVEKRCKYILSSILHQFEDFNIMTIDKFNLRLIKSFARDLDLPNDFEVVIDESEILEKIIDDLLNQLGNPQSLALEKLLIKYAESNIDQDASWNFRRSLIGFAKILKSEKDRKVVAKLLVMDLSVERYKDNLIEISAIDRDFLKLTAPIKPLLDQIDPILLPGKSRTFNSINKVVHSEGFFNVSPVFSNTLMGYIEDEVPKGRVFPQEIKDQLNNLIQFHDQHIYSYSVTRLFLKNFFNMALLQYMAISLEEVKKKEQIIRISEFNSLISHLIQNENAPYIYERFGTRFHHFLLDEFQDTSHLQWLNLVPLIDESISYGRLNLIVGDPKQSIYRFKNGIAEQFIALPKIYNPEGNDKINQLSANFEKAGKVNELNDNWRSSPKIVEFNNTFFESLKQKLPPETRDFYQSIHQTPQKKKNGLVYIESKKADEPDIVERIIKWIEECRADGFKLGDICILGEKNKECNLWALKLNDAGYKVVSTDSLLIQSNLHVQLSIAYFKWRLKPSGENEKKRFGELYFRINNATYDNYKKYIKELKTKRGKTFRYFDDTTFLSDYFNGENEFFFKYENLYDLIQGFYQIMKYNELENPYLHHLADIIYAFGLMKGPDLKGFITEYDSKKNKIAVQIPESDDAVKVMTIHKSKGLEFPVVILPSMNFDLSIKGEFLVEVDDVVIYKKASKSDKIGPLVELYNTEKYQFLTDKINMCYVAMTRPEERLYLLNSYTNTGFGAVFNQALKEAFDLTEDEEGIVCVNLSDGVRSKQKKQEQEVKLLAPVNIQDKLWFPDIALQDNDELTDANYLSDERQFGLQFHYLISLTDDKKEIDRVLEQAISEGEVSESNKIDLHKKMTQILTNGVYLALISGAVEIKNEKDIISADNKQNRPDKIVFKPNETIIIDYKTGIPNLKDEKQVLGYKIILEEMKYKSVSCYLFYTSMNEIRQIG